MALKSYASVGKGLKLKFKTFWGLTPAFVDVTGEKLVGGFFAHPIQNRVKERNLVLQVVRESQIKNKAVMIWSSRKKGEFIFSNVYFVEIFAVFVFYLNV